MSGGRGNRAPATALLIVLVLCWPMASAFAAAATAPAQHACCMRVSHGCHSHEQAGNSFQAICRACGWCHALPNANDGLTPSPVSFSFSIHTADIPAESAFQLSFDTPRLRASRAPPRAASLPQASGPHLHAV